MLEEAALIAWQLIRSADAGLIEIVLLSLQISGLATLLGMGLGLPLGAWTALCDPPWRGIAQTLLNAAMGLPPVVVGLIVYLLLSRSGPLGALGWLFTPAGMVFAQTVLITPIIAALTRQRIAEADLEYRDWFTSLGLSRWRRASTLLHECRHSWLVILLAGFGRAIAEVGTVIMVGGNIAGETRVMTTTIALETARGALPLALALGFILILIVLLIAATTQGLAAWIERHHA